MCAYCQTFFAIVVVGENRFEARLVEGVLILLFKICPSRRQFLPRKVVYVSYPIFSS